jgi:tRNA A37 N6-isopentenylltransferase MiaA
MKKTFGIVEAVESLKPNSEWSLNGAEYEGLEWYDKSQSKPTKKECLAEIERLQTEYDFFEYQRLRALEYPPITDYLDGVVKGDHAQIETYIEACLAVKKKYPKD